jgi:hypothetical protein
MMPKCIDACMSNSDGRTKLRPGRQMRTKRESQTVAPKTGAGDSAGLAGEWRWSIIGEQKCGSKTFCKNRRKPFRHSRVENTPAQMPFAGAQKQRKDAD